MTRYRITEWHSRGETWFVPQKRVLLFFWADIYNDYGSPIMFLHRSEADHYIKEYAV